MFDIVTHPQTASYTHHNDVYANIFYYNVHLYQTSLGDLLQAIGNISFDLNWFSVNWLSNNRYIAFPINLYSFYSTNANIILVGFNCMLHSQRMCVRLSHSSKSIGNATVDKSMNREKTDEK